MKSFLSETFRYQHHMNQVIGKALLDLGAGLPEDILDLYVHTVRAHQLWLERMQGEAMTNPHEPMELEEAMEQEQQNYLDTLALIEQDDLYRSMPYRNTKGEKHGNTVLEILYHVSNHSTHHRAQMAMRLRQIGHQPPATDYIFYRRLR